ncbi:MAG: alginate export family protein [Thermogutta sp.]
MLPRATRWTTGFFNAESYPVVRNPFHVSMFLVAVNGLTVIALSGEPILVFPEQPGADISTLLAPDRDVVPVGKPELAPTAFEDEHDTATARSQEPTSRSDQDNQAKTSPVKESATNPTSEPRPTSVVAPKPPNPYKGVFYENDFSYLDKPNNPYFYLGDALKRNRLGDWGILDIGGEYRLRQHNEHMLNRDNNFLLQRTRVYGDLHVGERLRAYAEAIDATSAWEDLPPRPTEENRFDALNLFADAKMIDADSGDLWFRGGRQELLYGNQRLISPLDWSNTRRTFDGVKLFWRGERWNIDGFWTRPVPFSQHVNNDHNFDHPDLDQEFYGLYMTRKASCGQTLDLYYLGYAKYNDPRPFKTHTFGSRWEGKLDLWLWEIEGAYQFGEYGPADHSAGFYTLGLGRKLARLGWEPTLWFYYDWASGDEDPTDGRHETFNQLFPLGHKYFGWMDLVGRQNIEDWNLLLTMKPHPAWEIAFWWHTFRLQEARDALYDAAGNAIRQDPTGAAGRDVGSEADVTVRWTFHPRADVLFGYSHLFPGRFLKVTPGGGDQSDFYYTQFSVRF